MTLQYFVIKMSYNQKKGVVQANFCKDRLWRNNIWKAGMRCGGKQ